MLDERQAAVLKLINSGSKYKEIAPFFGVSESRIRQIFLKAKALTHQANQVEKWTHGLNKKTENLLISAGYIDKNSVIDALASGEFTKNSGFGLKTIEVITQWVGNSQPNPTFKRDWLKPAP